MATVAEQPAARTRAPTAARPELRCHLAAIGLILMAAGLNLAYLVCDCPLDLAPDEAHYWHWSRRLDWSYYSKGPLVAWLIRASCELFGAASVRLVGSEMVAVRLPAVAANAALLAGLYVLTCGTLRSPRAGLAMVAVALTVPPVTAAAVVMTIDAPFLACWCWGLVFAWRAVTGSGLGWWVLAGLASGLGVLAKYPMLLFPVAVAAFLAADRDRRPLLRGRGFSLLVGLTAVGCVPIVAWNVAHDWVSVRHVLGQAAGTAGGIRWLGPAEFAAGQFGFLLGYWFVAFAAAAWVFRPGRVRDSGLSFLWWASVPVWSVFFLASFRTAGQVNWPAVSYVAGSVLAVAFVRTQLAAPARWYRRLVAGCAAVVVGLGLVLVLAIHYPGLVRLALAALAGPPTEANPAPIRRLDPTARLRGWRTLAAEVDRARARVRHATGEEPVVVGVVWTIPGELAFYCDGHPPTYSLGLALWDRHSQYDLWRPNPVADPDVFRGRSFVVAGEEIPDAAAVFDRVEPPVRVVHDEGGVPVAVWTVWVGHGFKGFPAHRIGRAKY
jgi:4-amino-4-deoxy-L-arabinose transferase-like glycosyltransferase